MDLKGVFFFQFGSLKAQTSRLTSHHLEMFKVIQNLQNMILSELQGWKREQQLSGNGKTFSNNLDTIQKW